MWFYRLLFLALLLKVANSGVINDKNDMISHFTYEINNWISVQKISEEFQQLISSLALPTSLQRENWRSFVGERSKTICIICESILNVFIEYRRQGMSEEDIKDMVIKLCTLLNLETEQVCQGVVTINLPIIMYIIDSKPNLTGSTICGVLLESQSCPLNDAEFNWTINIDNSPPKLIEPVEGDEMNLLQITDIHYDPSYEPYGNSQCGEPACCRKGQNDTNTVGELAGYWGDYNYCDIPWHTVVDVLDHVKAQHPNFSYVYFTGDVVDHGIWETTKRGNVESLNKFYHKIHETFGNASVYPVLGNHEPHPVNQYAPANVTNDEISTQWLYKMMADLWINDYGWLPESTRSTILQGGFYTVSPKKGFRIIGLNNNVCYSYNWWLWYQPGDQDGQLQWLADTLLQAEMDEEYVHILAHVPPGDEDCLSTWRREYIKIVYRFGHIIRAQFNGHTHNDELQLIYGSDDNMKLYNVAWNGGSATPFQNLNSNYKVYKVDSKNYAVTDFETWIYNLTLANTNPNQRPLWYKSYSFKEEYGISNLAHDSLHAWLSKLTSNETLQTRYYRHFFKHADPSLRKECDTRCMRSYMCRIITSVGDHKAKCNDNREFTSDQLSI